MLIKVKKIIRSKARTEAGRAVPDPIGAGKLTEERVVEEAINVDSIKAIRTFRNDGHSHRNVDGQKCVIYLFNLSEDEDSKRKNKTAEIHVVADYDKLIEEVNALKSGRVSKGSLRPKEETESAESS